MIKKYMVFVYILVLIQVSCSHEEGGTITQLIGSRGQQGGKLILTINGPQPEINPLKVRSDEARAMYYLIYDNLIDIDRNLQFVPRLAKSWEISADATKLTFHLRDDVHWHDDRLFTANDVIYSFERYRELPDPERPGQKLFQRVLRLEAPNPYTVIVHYDSPNILALADWLIEIVPRLGPQEETQVSGTTLTIIGSGPYVIKSSSVQQQKISLKVFESYWNGRGHISEIEIRFIPSGHSARQLFSAGEIDHYHLSTDEVSVDSLKQLRKTMQFINFPCLSYYYIGWRCGISHNFFRHRRIRKAMSLALDRDKINAELFSGLGQLCDVPVPDWALDKNVRSIPYSPTLAIDLLRETGCKDANSDGIRELNNRDFSFTLIYAVKDSHAKFIADHFQNSLRKIGVIMTPLGLPDQEFSRRLKAGEFDAFLGMDRISLGLANLKILLGCDDKSDCSGRNILGFYDPELNSLLSTLYYNGSIESFDRLIYQLSDRILQEQPCTFIIYKPSFQGLSNRIRITGPARSGLWQWYPSVLDWFIPRSYQQKKLDAVGDE